jgi:hypothetical protein
LFNSGRTIVYRLKMSVLEDALLGFAHTVGWEIKPQASTRTAGPRAGKPRTVKGEV